MHIFTASIKLTVPAQMLYIGMFNRIINLSSTMQMLNLQLMVSRKQMTSVIPLLFQVWRTSFVKSKEKTDEY